MSFFIALCKKILPQHFFSLSCKIFSITLKPFLTKEIKEDNYEQLQI